MKSRKPNRNLDGTEESNTLSFVVVAVLFFGLIFLVTWYLAASTQRVETTTQDLSRKVDSTKKMINDLNTEIGRLRRSDTAFMNPSSLDVEKRPSHVEEIVKFTPSKSDNSREKFASDDSIWMEALLSKMSCIRKGKMSIFLYHIRKAAGTTLRNIIEQASKTWNIPFYESEGITLDESFLSSKSTLSVVSLREPIERIQSLYWYEHVGWWDGIVHDMSKCKTFSQWTAAWKDGSDWKKAFTAKNPGSVYVEIENYYVKSLSGWRGGPLDNAHLQKAKTVLQRFDLVLLSDHLANKNHLPLLDAALQMNCESGLGHELRGDKSVRTRLASTLAADQDRVLADLRRINQLDLQLWTFARTLVADRAKALSSASSSARLDQILLSQESCLALQPLSPALSVQLGIHRPPGHKGPIDGFITR